MRSFLFLATTAFSLAGAALAKPEKEIFVDCTPASLEATFGDKFEKEPGKAVHPVWGEELSLQGYKQVGTKLIEDRSGTAANFRERREILDTWNGAGGKHRVHCQAGKVAVVILTWSGDLNGFHSAMEEKYGWTVSRTRFASDLDKFLAKGLVYVVKDEKARVVTARISEVDGKTRVRVHYYHGPRLKEEIHYLLNYEEERKKAEQEKYRKAKESLL